MLAFLLASAGTYLIKTYRFGFVGAIPLYVAVMALYQSYISVAIGLLVLIAFQDSIKQVEWRKQLQKAISYVSILAASAIFYWLIYKTILVFTGISANTGYNGLSSLETQSLIDILKKIPTAYVSFFAFFFNGGEPSNSPLVMAANIFYFFITVVCLIRCWWVQRAQIVSVLFQVLEIGVLPLALNFSFILSGGLAHTLMKYSFYLVYIIGIILMKSQPIEKDTIRVANAIVVTCVVISFSNIRYANDLYYHQKLVGERSSEVLFQIAFDMEEEPEYVAGETRVVVLGDWNNSLIQANMGEFEQFGGAVGHTDSAFTYLGTLECYFEYVLGWPIRVEYDEHTIQSWEDNSLVEKMPVYPNDGYCQMIDNTMILKLGEL